MSVVDMIDNFPAFLQAFMSMNIFCSKTAIQALITMILKNGVILMTKAIKTLVKLLGNSFIDYGVSL